MELTTLRRGSWHNAVERHPFRKSAASNSVASQNPLVLECDGSSFEILFGEWFNLLLFASKLSTAGRTGKFVSRIKYRNKWRILEYSLASDRFCCFFIVECHWLEGLTEKIIVELSNCEDNTTHLSTNISDNGRGCPRKGSLTKSGRMPMKVEWAGCPTAKVEFVKWMQFPHNCSSCWIFPRKMRG